MPNQNPLHSAASLSGDASNRCNSCGASNVPLHHAHVFPSNKSKTSSLEGSLLLCPNCHRISDSFNPSELEFTTFLGQLLQKHPDFSNVVIDNLLEGQSGARADITATKRSDGRVQTVLIESKNRSFFRHMQVEDAIAQIERYRKLRHFDTAALAFPGRVSKEDRSKIEQAFIEIWDFDYVSREFAKEIKKLPPTGFSRYYSITKLQASISPFDSLIQRLTDCTPGKRDWIKFQKIIRDVFELLFTPALGLPIWESSDNSRTNRRDIIFPNYAPDGFWKFLGDKYQADFIVIDPKNYSTKISKAQVLQIANYLKPHGAGMFGIIASRKGGDIGCTTTRREQWAAYRKLIILLTDDDIKAMLLAADSHGKPELVIGQIIQEFRLSM